MLHIGFTATRHGLSDLQLAAARKLIATIIGEHKVGNVFIHHGDCVGGDQQLHDIAVEIYLAVVKVIHPPADDSLRAFCTADDMREPKTHFARNRDIVNESNVLIGCPFDMVPQARGGTYYTLDYARKHGCRGHVVLPDGTVKTVVEFCTKAST